MRRPGETDVRRRLEDGTVAIPQARDVRAVAKRSFVIESAQVELRACVSDADRLALIRDMTKGYCLHCGGVIGNDGRCTPGCP